MTCPHRSAPDGMSELVLTSLEVRILNELIPRRGRTKPGLSEYFVCLAKLGGYLNRDHDPDLPPGTSLSGEACPS